MFNLVIDDTIETRNKTSKLYIGRKKVKPAYLHKCIFADDLVLFAKNATEMKTYLKIWKGKLNTRSLKINEEKTRIKITRKDNTIDIDITIRK